MTGMAAHPAGVDAHHFAQSRTFPATPGHASQARRFLASVLNGSSLADDALACLGELANNAITHSDSRLPGGAFTVRVHSRPGLLRVEVCDDGGPWEPRPTTDDAADGNDSASLAISGRGFLIVAALADAWDITPKTTATTRTAWFEMTGR